MKLCDFDSTADIIDAETVDIIEELDKLDHKSDEYSALVANVVKFQTAIESTMRARSEYLNSKVPSWAISLIGVALSTALFGVVLREERNGGIVSTQAISLWDKVTRKFG